MIINYTLIKRLITFCISSALSCLTAGYAQPTPSNTIPDSQKQTTLWEKIKGQPTDNKVYLGMWTVHFNANSRDKDNSTNDLIEGSYHGYYVGAFKNSYYDWTYTAGLQRDTYKKIWSPQNELVVGYRAGAMIGYDNRLCHFCGDIPAVPYVIPYMAWQYKNIGVESQFAYILSTVAFYYNFQS